MTVNLRGCLAVETASILMLGCADPDAAARKDTQIKFQASLDKVARANRGFSDGPSGQAADLAEFRAQLLAQAASELNSLIGQGSPVQQMATARTLGQTYAALAMHQTNLAQMRWSALWNPTSELLQKVALVTGAQVRAQSLEVNQQPGLEKLNEYQTGFNQQAQQAQARVSTLTASLADLQSKHKNLLTQRDEVLAQVQALNQKAFTLTGQAQFETYQAALAAERKAQLLDAEAEKLAAVIGIHQADLSITEQSAKLATANVQVIQTQSQALTQRQSDAAAQHQALIHDDQSPASVKSRESALADVLTQVMQTYHEQIQPAFDQADKSAALSVTMTEKALSLATGDASRRRSLQADLLAAYATRLEVQSRWIAAQGNLARVLAVVDTRLAQTTTLRDRVQTLRDKITVFKNAMTQAVEESVALKAKSDELAGQLSTPGSDANTMSAFLVAQNQRITQAVNWIQASKM